jgi:hypothetical protein
LIPKDVHFSTLCDILEHHSFDENERRGKKWDPTSHPIKDDLGTTRCVGMNKLSTPRPSLK